MTLGERIRALRMKHNLSQEDLAAALEVSRQSVSKWETDASTPDLDRLVKLSEVFHVTLDELVRGDAPRQAGSYTPQPEKTRTPIRVVVGIVLLSLAVVFFWGGTLLDGNLGTGLVLAVPFVFCGTVCILVSWHPGLVCAWGLSVVGDCFVALSMRCAWRVVLRTVSRVGFAYFEAGWKFFDFGMMLLQLAWIVFLLVWTGKCLRPHIPVLDRKKRTLLAGGWLLFVLLHAPWLLWGRYMLLLVLADWLRFAWLTVLVTCELAGKQQNQEKPSPPLA